MFTYWLIDEDPSVRTERMHGDVSNQPCLKRQKSLEGPFPNQIPPAKRGSFREKTTQPWPSCSADSLRAKRSQDQQPTESSFMDFIRDGDNATRPNSKRTGPVNTSRDIKDQMSKNGRIVTSCDSIDGAHDLGILVPSIVIDDNEDDPFAETDQLLSDAKVSNYQTSEDTKTKDTPNMNNITEQTAVRGSLESLENPSNDKYSSPRKLVETVHMQDICPRV